MEYRPGMCACAGRFVCAVVEKHWSPPSTWWWWITVGLRRLRGSWPTLGQIWAGIAPTRSIQAVGCLACSMRQRMDSSNGYRQVFVYGQRKSVQLFVIVAAGWQLLWLVDASAAAVTSAGLGPVREPYSNLANRLPTCSSASPSSTLKSAYVLMTAPFVSLATVRIQSGTG